MRFIPGELVAPLWLGVSSLTAGGERPASPLRRQWCRPLLSERAYFTWGDLDALIARGFLPAAQGWPRYLN